MNLGNPVREIIVEPVQVPVPVREGPYVVPTEPAPKPVPKPEPALILAHTDD